MAAGRAIDVDAIRTRRNAAPPDVEDATRMRGGAAKDLT